MIRALVARVALVPADCEAVRDGLLAQPANSLSSLAYLVVAGWLAARAWRQPGPHPLSLITFALAVAANGVGSLWYHGHPDDIGHLVHDLAIVALLLTVITFDTTLVTGRGSRTVVAVVVAALVVAGAYLWAFPDATNLIAIILMLMLIGADVRVARGARIRGAPVVPPGHRTAKILLGVSLAAAAVVNLLGRSGSFACEPDSLLQFHAAWHVLGAVAAGAYAVAIMKPRTHPFPRQ